MLPTSMAIGRRGAGRLGIVLLLLLVVSVGCTRVPDVEVVVGERVMLSDEPLDVRLTGLPPGAEVEVAAAATDTERIRWRSSARFRASRHGEVTLADASTAGPYLGRNSTGLLELMRPDRGSSGVFESPPNGFDVTLTATVDGAVVATTTVRRRSPQAAGVRSRALSTVDTGVHGTLFLPATTEGRSPGLLLFGGAGGGEEYAHVAAQIAAHGYPVLSLAYFGAAGLPPSLDRIPLEYFARALRALAAEPQTDPERPVVLGTSRGSEAAILLGLHHPDLVSGVIAVDPTDHANVSQLTFKGPAWTWLGRGVPTAPSTDFGVADPVDRPSSVFPVERSSRTRLRTSSEWVMMTVDLPILLPDEVAYSTRTCRRCGVPMARGVDASGRRTWTCADCGAAARA